MKRLFLNLSITANDEALIQALNESCEFGLKKTTDSDLLKPSFEFDYGYMVFDRAKGLGITVTPNEDKEGRLRYSSQDNGSWILSFVITGSSKFVVDGVMEEIKQKLDSINFEFKEIQE